MKKGLFSAVAIASLMFGSLVFAQEPATDMLPPPAPEATPAVAPTPDATPTPTATGSGLTLVAGTKQVGGTIFFEYSREMPEVGDAVGGYSFSFAPSVGYFLMDNLELLGDLTFTVFGGDLYQNMPKAFGLHVGAKYYIPINTMAAYAGALIGMGASIGDNATLKTFDVQIPLGILYPLNTWVALDLGLRFNYSLGLDDQGSSMNLPIGYLGVQSFF